jgi:hypothetical protein
MSSLCALESNVPSPPLVAVKADSSPNTLVVERVSVEAADVQRHDPGAVRVARGVGGTDHDTVTSCCAST